MITKNASSALDELVERIRTSVGVPAINAGIVIDGQMILSASGLSDTKRGWQSSVTSRFSIACLTKFLVAIVVGNLVKSGVISFDQSLDHWLSERLKYTHGANLRRGLTLRHLLTHTGGYQGMLMYKENHRSLSWPDFSVQFSEAAQIFDAGSVFNYENTGHVIIGAYLEDLTGKNTDTLIKEFILDPLEIVPGSPLDDFRLAQYYVSPHHMEEGIPKACGPSVFGKFWRSSLADMTLSIKDLLVIGSAIVSAEKKSEFSFAREIILTRNIEVPSTVSGKIREHSPAFFNSMCAEYGSGWYGYAGSAMGQTCALRFDLRTNSVCAVALNAWLPLVRDFLIDQMLWQVTHDQSGKSGGNTGWTRREILGNYIGGGNIIRAAKVISEKEGEIIYTLEEPGLASSPQWMQFDEEKLELVPQKNLLTPGIGFFKDPADGMPCLMVGVAALKKVA